MPILGLLMLLEDAQTSTLAGVRHQLVDRPDLELGDATGHRLPAVLEAPNQRDAELRIDSLREVPGVAGIDVVYADFEDLLEPRAQGAAATSTAHEEV